MLEYDIGSLRHSNPSQLLIEVNRAFRFSDQQRLRFSASVGHDARQKLLQKGTHIRPILEAVTHVLETETGQSDSSTLNIIQASASIQNAAWYDGPHLTEVVSQAGKLLAKRSPLLARENAASALKNSAFFAGRHIKDAISYALQPRTGQITPRIIDGCVRTILYASAHSREQLKGDEVRQFLVHHRRNENEIIAGHAQQAYRNIFDI